MTSDPTSRPARRGTRGPARSIAGLALAAVLGACGGGDPSDADASAEPTAVPTPTASTPVPQTQAPAAPARASTAIAGPYTLRIPRIGVDAPVVDLTSGADRVLLPPKDPDIVGWWSDGAAPGAPEGSAILVGHTVRGGGGVFGAMEELEVGDTMDVAGADAALTYTVQSVDVLSKDEVAARAEQIFAQTGPGRLVVVTCADWDGKTWRSNIITVAAPA